MCSGVRWFQRVVVITIIGAMNIAGVNLNLLVSFDALMEERSVTRAAQRMGLSQSAMSNALAQLRLLFDDELFVRTKTGIAPTMRAQSIAEPIRNGLAQLGVALSTKSSYDAASSECTFVIAANDYVEYVVLPRLLRRLAEEAPGVRIELRHWDDHVVPDTLRTGEVDLAIGYVESIPQGHEQKLLFEEDYLFVARAGHPKVQGKVDLETYLELSHVVAHVPSSVAPVDVELTKVCKTRRVGLRVSHFLLVPALLAETDLVAALSRRIAEPFAKMLPLQLLPVPVEVPPLRVGSIWHQRMTADPAHTWLRKTIGLVCCDI